MMYLSSQPPWFTFIVHPRDVAEFLTMPGGSLIREYSESDEDFVRKSSSNPPIVLEDVGFVGSSIRGEVIAVPKLPDSLLTPEGHHAVVESVRVAAHRGARVVGLGALTAPATASGRGLIRHAPPGVTITNGNGLTAAVVRDNVIEAAESLGLGASARVAVIGATGSVGYPLSHLLADDDFELVLIGPSDGRVVRRFGELVEGGRAVAAAGLNAAGDADVVVVLTSSAGAQLSPGDVKPGAVVIDVAQPCNVPDDETGEFRAHGVEVVRGGAVRIPGYSCRRDFRLASTRDCFACLAETYLIAREGIRDHSVGLPTPEHARRMASLATRHRIEVCPLGLENSIHSESANGHMAATQEGSYA